MSKRQSPGRGTAYFLSMLLLPVFAMAACEAPQQEDEWEMDTDVQEEPAQQENDTVAFSSGLDEIDDSGVSGEVTMMRPRDNGAVTVIVELENLPGEGEYQASLFEGECDALQNGMMEDPTGQQQGQQQEQEQQQQQEQDPQMQQEGTGMQVADLNAVQGLADGTGMSQTTLQAADIPMQQPLSVRVMGQGQQNVACADIDSDEWEQNDQQGDTWNDA